MRRRHLARATVLVLVGTTVFATTAAAGGAPLVLTDLKGDANGLNGQGVVPGVDGQPGPGSEDGRDIVSLTLSHTGDNRCTGYTAIIELAAKPMPNLVYRVAATTETNKVLFWMQYINNAAGVTRLLYDDGSGPKFIDLLNPAKVDGTRISIEVTRKDLAAANEKLLTFTLIKPAVEIRGSTGIPIATFPVWDVLANRDKNFKPCG